MINCLTCGREYPRGEKIEYCTVDCHNEWIKRNPHHSTKIRSHYSGKHRKYRN